MPARVRIHPTTLHRLPAAIAIGTLVWLALLVATPVARAGSGSMRLVAELVHHACGRICHQRPERSFTTAGATWPVCGRCAGLYSGAALGAWLALGDGVRRRRIGRHVPAPSAWRVPLVASAAPTALTWGLEAAGLAGISTDVRFAAALPLGAFAAWAVTQSLAHDAGTGLH